MWSFRGVAPAAVLLALSVGAQAQSLGDGAKAFRPFVVEHAGKALAGAKEMQGAMKANDVKAAQAAWIKSRRGWEAIETVTAEIFPEFDKKVDP